MRKHSVQPCLLPVSEGCTATLLRFCGPTASTSLHLFASAARVGLWLCMVSHASAPSASHAEPRMHILSVQRAVMLQVAQVHATNRPAAVAAAACDRRATGERHMHDNDRLLVLWDCAAPSCPNLNASATYGGVLCQEDRRPADSSSDDASSSLETSSRAVAKAPVDPARAAARVAEEAQVAQGQRTAVITGAVSIVFGVRHSFCTCQLTTVPCCEDCSSAGDGLKHCRSSVQADRSDSYSL